MWRWRGIVGSVAVTYSITMTNTGQAFAESTIKVNNLNCTKPKMVSSSNNTSSSTKHKNSSAAVRTRAKVCKNTESDLIESRSEDVSDLAEATSSREFLLGQRHQRSNVLVLGGPGSGKHTLCERLRYGYNQSTRMFYAGKISFSSIIVKEIAATEGQTVQSKDVNDSDADNLTAVWNLRPSKELQRMSNYLRDSMLSQHEYHPMQLALKGIPLEHTLRNHTDPLLSCLFGKGTRTRHGGWFASLDVSSGESIIFFPRLFLKTQSVFLSQFGFR